MHKVSLRITLLLLLLSSPYYAGNIKKAYKALYIYNYFEAKRLFEASLSKAPIPAAFGLSNIYYRTDNPFSNIDSAYKYIIKCENNFKIADEKTKKELLSYEINQQSIDSIKTLVNNRAFVFYKSKNSAEALNKFISIYTTSPQYFIAINLRDSIAFADAIKQDTYEAYKEFIKTYPKAKEIEKSRELYSLKHFQHITENNSLKEFEDFIENNPTSPLVNEAENAIYKLSINNGTIEEYETFVKNYPNNHNVSDAWRSLYYMCTKEYTLPEFESFKNKYPDFPHKYLLLRDLESIKKKFYPILSNGKWGFVDNEGTVVVPCLYDWVEEFSEGFAGCSFNEKAGFIDGGGKVVIPFHYEHVESFLQGTAIVQKDKKYGIINKRGKEVIPFEYDEIADYSEGFAVVSINEKYGYINAKGNVIIPTIYSEAGDFNEGFAVVKMNEQFGYIDTSGKQLTVITFDWCGNFENGRAKVQLNNKFGIIDKAGDTLLPFIYDFLGDYSEGAIIIVKNGKYGFADTTGNIIIPLDYDFSDRSLLSLKFKNNMVVAELNNKQHLINRKGKSINKTEYTRIQPFSSGLAAVELNGKWGYIDTTFKIKIPCAYQYAGEFTDTLAKVRDENGKVGFINKSGSVSIPLIYDDATSFKNGQSIVTISGKLGLIDLWGRSIVECSLDDIKEVNDQMYLFKKAEKMAYFNFKDFSYFWKEEDF
jgi:hypothetical protein